jgi:hypothetical protein
VAAQYLRPPAEGILGQHRLISRPPHRFAAFRDTIAALRSAGKPIRHTEAGHDFVMISLGHKNLTGTDTVQVGERVLSFQALGLSNTPIEDTSETSAYHIPQGCLVIYDPQDRAPKAGRAEMLEYPVTSSASRTHVQSSSSARSLRADWH